jgi:hypothetical protein
MKDDSTSLFFNYLGKNITETDIIKQWTLGKPEKSDDRNFYKNHPLGIELYTNVKGMIKAIWLYGIKEKKIKPFTGSLPFGVTFAMSRKESRKLLGEPKYSGEKGGLGIMAVERNWDKWQNEKGQSLRLEYAVDDNSIYHALLMDTEMEIKILYDGKIKGSHHSIYLQDMDSKADAGEIWNTKADVTQIAHPGKQMVGISIPRYAETYLTFSYCSMETCINTLEGIDHCNEFSIEVTSQLQVGNFFETFTNLDVAPGIYRARVMNTFLHTVKNDEEGDDKYSIELWPDTEVRELVILK